MIAEKNILSSKNKSDRTITRVSLRAEHEQ